MKSSWVTTSLVSISYIFPPTVVLRTIFLILNICYELTINYQYESCNSHMGMFIKPIFYFAVRKFVNRQPQQIFMIENTEYRANLVKPWVNFPVFLLHIYYYRVCQYKLFLILEGWKGFTEPSKPSLEYHWSGKSINFQQQYCSFHWAKKWICFKFAQRKNDANLCKLGNKSEQRW